MYCLVFLGHFKKAKKKAKAYSLSQSGLKKANFLEFGQKRPNRQTGCLRYAVYIMTLGSGSQTCKSADPFDDFH